MSLSRSTTSPPEGLTTIQNTAQHTRYGNTGRYVLVINRTDTIDCMVFYSYATTYRSTLPAAGGSAQAPSAAPFLSVFVLVACPLCPRGDTPLLWKHAQHDTIGPPSGETLHCCTEGRHSFLRLVDVTLLYLLLEFAHVARHVIDYLPRAILQLALAHPRQRSRAVRRDARPRRLQCQVTN